MGVAQNLQCLGYEVRSINIAKMFRTRIIYSIFWDMRHYTTAACCYATRTYDIHLDDHANDDETGHVEFLNVVVNLTFVALASVFERM